MSTPTQNNSAKSPRIGRSDYYKHIMEKHNKLVTEVKSELQAVIRKQQEELQNVLSSRFGSVEDFVGRHMEDDSYARSQGYEAGITDSLPGSAHDSVFILNQDFLVVLSTIQDKLENGKTVTMEDVGELDEVLFEEES